jgi:hypothetical protein
MRFGSELFEDKSAYPAGDEIEVGGKKVFRDNIGKVVRIPHSEVNPVALAGTGWYEPDFTSRSRLLE